MDGQSRTRSPKIGPPARAGRVGAAENRRVAPVDAVEGCTDLIRDDASEGEVIAAMLLGAKSCMAAGAISLRALR